MIPASDKLAVHESGAKSATSARPVVILHGVPGKRSYFSPLIEALATKRRVLFVDMPGYGNSPMLDGRYTMQRCIEAIADALHRHGATHVDIIGHSVGGYRALALALSGRVDVRRAVLLGAFAGLSDAERDRYRQFVALLQGPTAKELLPTIWLGLALHPGFIATHPAETAEILSHVEEAGPGVMEAECAAIAECEDLRPRLRDLRVPLLARVGELEAGGPLGWCEEIAALAPLSRVQRVPGCSHMLLVENRDETLAAILEALDTERWP